MRYIAILIGLGLLGFLGYKMFMQPGSTPGPKFGIVEEPPPPPPPPQLQEPPPMVLDPEALEKVRTATRDSDPQVRWEAVQFLVQSRDPQAEEAMYSMLHRDSESSIRRNVVGLVEKQRGPKVTQNLIQALRDTDTEVRLAALAALGRIGDYSAAPAITEAIRDMDERVRLEAIRTLKTLEGTRSEQIQTNKRDHDEKVRAWEQEVKKRQEEQQKQAQQQKKK